MGKTRGVHETTPELRNRMVGMYEAGLGLREIAAAVNCSQRTVKRWLNRFDKEGTVETRERCGRKRATTSEQDEAIIRLASQTPITAAKAVLPALGLSCSVDTVRERLHKAGIHNWSPSRKHMQRIPLGTSHKRRKPRLSSSSRSDDIERENIQGANLLNCLQTMTSGNEADGAGIQQSVWRPTGTQLGKKKSSKETIKGRKGISTGKKKLTSRKAKTKDLYIGDGAPAEALRQPGIQPSFAFSSQQNLQQSQSVQQIQNNDLQTSSQSLPVNQTQFSNALSLAQQPIYQHPGLNVAQNWPLDLVQGSHHYPQGQPNPMVHEHPQPQQQLQELHTQREQQQRLQEQAQQQGIHHQSLDPQQQQQRQHQQQQEPQGRQRQTSTIELSPSHSDAKILRIDSCSNSSNSNDNSQMSDGDGDTSKDGSKKNDTRQKQKRKKKGGKAKGTLETSVEIRNRMIGMSEAGLSTLSIALAINRSERTVKRWLERWHKEGNVQTKERKGRRRITTKEQDEAIIAMATQHPLTAAKYVAPALGLRCSVDTIRERLHKAGIHSWKLGKKQGEGNAVHTVHLWQPSGNRPNKPKMPSEKKKRSVGGKRYKSATRDAPKRAPRKNKIDSVQLKAVPPPANMIIEQNAMQFHNTSRPNIIQPVHDISAPPPPPPPPPLPPAPHAQQTSLPGSQVAQAPPGPQSLQQLGPIMQQRPDCRLAPPVGPPTSNQGNNVAYPACMVGATGHAGHMEQPDPLNYEPYMWNF